MAKVLKPVDRSKNPGLAKLPTEVRNKMGFQKSGGKTKKAKGGASLKPKAPTAANVSKKLGSRLKNGGTLSPTASSVSRRLASPFKNKKARGGASLSPSSKSTSNRLASNLKLKSGGKMKMGGKCRGGCY